jgi:hypothetical protein
MLNQLVTRIAIVCVKEKKSANGELYIYCQLLHLQPRLLSYLLSNGTRNLWLPWDWEYCHGELQLSVQLSGVQVDA